MTRKPTSRRPRKADIKAAAERAEQRSRGEEPEIAKTLIDPILTVPEDVMATTAPKRGRPTKYRPEYARIASALCRRGATDFELAEEFDVNTTTIWRWSVQHDDFRKAVQGGKEAFDDRVERALAQRAIGYTYHTEKVFNFQGEIVRADTVEHVPADIGAAKLWLTNRRPKQWREVQRHEHGGVGDFDSMSDEELKDFIRHPDGRQGRVAGARQIR